MPNVFGLQYVRIWMLLFCLPFSTGRFAATGKSISNELAAGIAQRIQSHPYFVQQYAQPVWQAARKKATATDMEQALEDLLDQYSILYQKEADMLTNFQLNFLKALCKKETAYTSQQVLQEYKLGTSTNVSRIKTALQNHEILDLLGREVSFNDLMFELGLKKRYFNREYFNE